MRDHEHSEEHQKIRLDKWLWAARFFKTRSLAVQAIETGKIQVNGQRPKPSREVMVGQEIVARTGDMERTVIVRALSLKRGPASEAALLYEETEASRQRRLEQAELRRHAAIQRDSGAGRPTKKDRRQIRRFVSNESS